jgi:hypothetical protein
MTVFRDITFLAAGPQVNAAVKISTQVPIAHYRLIRGANFKFLGKVKIEECRRKEGPAFGRHEAGKSGRIFPSSSSPFITHENGPPRKPGGPLMLFRG